MLLKFVNKEDERLNGMEWNQETKKSFGHRGENYIYQKNEFGKAAAGGVKARARGGRRRRRRRSLMERRRRRRQGRSFLFRTDSGHAASVVACRPCVFVEGTDEQVEEDAGHLEKKKTFSVGALSQKFSSLDGRKKRRAGEGLRSL